MLEYIDPGRDVSILYSVVDDYFAASHLQMPSPIFRGGFNLFPLSHSGTSGRNAFLVVNGLPLAYSRTISSEHIGLKQFLTSSMKYLHAMKKRQGHCSARETLAEHFSI